MNQSHPRSHPSRVFLDSSATLALVDNSDAHHFAASGIYEHLTQSRPRIYTSNFITGESYTLILSNLGRHAAIQFLDRLYASSFTIERVSPADERRAEELLRRYQDKLFSYTDATSFVVMERLGITQAFTFDRNFSQYGFILLQPR